MASTPGVSDPPDHPSSSVGSTINSGSDGFDTPSRSESRESSPGPLVIDDGVSNPFPHFFSLTHGTSTSNIGDGEDMTEEEFFAQLGEEVPEWAKRPPSAEPQVQDDGFPDLLEEDLEAQLDAELGAAAGNGSMDISEGDLEAQLEAELAAGDNGGLIELCEDDLEAQLNAELEAEAHQEMAAKAARREANLQEEMRIAAEKAALAVPCDQRDDSPFSSEDELQAELNAGDAADEFLSDVNDRIAVMMMLKSKVDCLTVRQYSSRRPNKKVKTTPTGTPKARVSRGQAPPMRRTDELPELYHHGAPNWALLRKHMNLSTRVDLNTCYRSLGLDVGRGKAVYESLKEYLRIPGNSVDLSAKDVESEDAKRIIATIAHKLLVDQRWGQTYFNRPSLAADCKSITFEGGSTEVFLEFTSLVYKAMKLEEKRKKGKAKQQEETAAREVVQHPTSEAFATSTYRSPQQAPSTQSAAERPLPVVMLHPPPRRRQAAINGVVIAPCSVARARPS
ncbi:hypothetical protein INS49_007016 [Diaporthe citri]|uniref:uncharacterized protein n=1 Tax=Diaporthe citri TaxID=83186 RepID=UPI001C7EE7D7|nr:uncharacterized protein INS49_007016 [Diaporthe citri]KAG6365405.1 hypothetical protein INS49_007016 [Diaporthe citri]